MGHGGHGQEGTRVWSVAQRQGGNPLSGLGLTARAEPSCPPPLHQADDSDVASAQPSEDQCGLVVASPWEVVAWQAESPSLGGTNGGPQR